MALDNKLLGHIRGVGESKTWADEVMRVTMDYSWTEHSLAMPDNDIHARNPGRNLVGRGRSSMNGDGRMSTRDRSHKHNG